MNKKIIVKYPMVCVSVEAIFLDFLSSYIVKFRYVYRLQTNRESLWTSHGDLRLKLQPNIQNLHSAH